MKEDPLSLCDSYEELLEVNRVKTSLPKGRSGYVQYLKLKTI